ncbi:TonB-dependent receptor [Methylovorus glucosotrophus]|uniref:TonB-dependent siderophore receptor n=1 Tax=Methylovorus glucosotrophus (strain SIP3-4) TaxID=582744 RepID=C6X943_METGS|nr:TonB-dependent receptor [Methylovorus glucosotrophus]ACT49663.1 TonB-dependent siderophore receptor [Methylovorus glucosotrophus SIP3-4]
MTTSSAWGRASLLHLAIVTCLCQMTQAHAADASPASHLQIAAQPLGQALTELAAKTGMLIGVDADLVRNKQAKPINGQYQPEDALTALLAGSGLQAVKGSNGSYTLKPNPANVEKPQSHAEPTTLPEVSVSAANESSANVQEEGKAADGYRVKTISSVGALGSMRLQDTPYAISVIPQELIQNIQAQSPDDVYKLNPSTRTTTPQITGFSPNVNIRGFDGYNTAEDGMRRAYNHAATMEDKERVEVLNGLSGFLYGAANPGGMINFVYKRPTMERLNSVTVGNYGGSQAYVHGDFGGRIDDEGRAGYRLNVVKQDGGTALDHQSIQRELISGAIDWQITDKLLLELNAVYNHYKIDAVSPYWYVASGIQRPSAPDTSKYWGQKWSGDEFHNTKLMSKLTYQLNDHITLRGAYMRDYINREGTAGTYNYPQSSTTYQQLALAGADSEDVYNAGQAFADIRFDTGSISHKVTTGYYMNSDLYRGSDYDSGASTLGPFSMRSPTYVAKPAFAADTASLYTKGRDINENLMLGDLVTFNEQWSMLAGVNRSRILSLSYNEDNSKSSSYDKSRTSPAISLIYKPMPWLTSYLSYIEGLEAGGRAPTSLIYTNHGEVMPPMVSRQQEFGLKASVGKVLLTTAIFEIEKAYQYTEVIDSSSSVYRQNGRQNHKGIEFGATGKATDRLTVITGLTLMDATVKKSENAGNVPMNVAQQFAKVYSEYQIPGVEGLTLTGGVYYTGKQYADDANTDRLPSYVTADIGARYQTTVSNRPLTLRLNVNNLFDKDYWLNAYYLGTPRSLAFSAQMQF